MPDVFGSHMNTSGGIKRSCSGVSNSKHVQNILMLSNVWSLVELSFQEFLFLDASIIVSVPEKF